MTETQYLLGWIVYLTGGTGCILGLWLLVRHWHVRLKRVLMAFFAIIIYLPGITHPDMSFLSPAFLTTLYDALTYGPEAALRTGKVVALIAGIASFIALVLPVKKTKPPKDQPSQPEADSHKRNGNNGHRAQQRKEPIY